MQAAWHLYLTSMVTSESISSEAMWDAVCSERVIRDFEDGRSSVGEDEAKYIMRYRAVVGASL